MSTPRGAADERQGDDRRPGRHVALAARPVLGDRAGELVAEDDRLVRAAEAVVARARGEVGPVVEAVARVQVRAADAAAQHLEAHLPAPGRGLGPVDDLELGVLADDRAHAPTLAQPVGRVSARA